eukprot:g2096.t1
MTFVACWMVATASIPVATTASIPVDSTATENRFGVVVQLFEWSYADIAAECETFLGIKGYDAVQISPPQEHIVGDQWWTRYQPVSYALVSRSGDKAGLKDMIERCAAVNVSIIADAVLNHMAAGDGVGTAGNTFTGRTYPAAGYTAANSMHHTVNNPNSNCGVHDYTNLTNVQECDLTGLPDLCSECDSTQGTLRTYLAALVDAGISGLRIDAAKHQDATSLRDILRDFRGVVYQEVIEGVGEAVTPDMYYLNGRVTEFRFAQNAVGPCFLANDRLQDLEKFVGGSNDPFGVTVPSESALVFTDNHDTQRGGAPITYQKSGEALYALANIFMLAHPFGLPRVMSSYSFSSHDQGPPNVPVHTGNPARVNCAADDGDGWICEHRLPSIANMIAFRRAAMDAPLTNWKTFAANQIAFSRGSNAFIAINRDESSELHLDSVATNLSPGRYCNVILDDDPTSCPTVVVASDGTLSGGVSVSPMSALAIHIS